MHALIAIRHLPLAGVGGRCYGRSDIAPDGAAIDVAAPALAAALPHWPILSSPASRCRLLADALAVRLEQPLSIEPRLAEADFGEWEGRAWDSIERAALDAWAADLRHFRPPAGETAAELFDRVAACVDALGGPAILITHAGPIRALWHCRGGLAFEAAAAVAVPHGVPLSFRPR